MVPCGPGNAIQLPEGEPAPGFCHHKRTIELIARDLRQLVEDPSPFQVGRQLAVQADTAQQPDQQVEVTFGQFDDGDWVP